MIPFQNWVRSGLSSHPYWLGGGGAAPPSPCQPASQSQFGDIKLNFKQFDADETMRMLPLLNSLALNVPQFSSVMLFQRRSRATWGGAVEPAGSTFLIKGAITLPRRR